METIIFDKSLYSLKAVKAALAAYQGLADFGLVNKAKVIKVIINNPDQEAADVLADELANYVLAQMKTQN